VGVRIFPAQDGGFRENGDTGSSGASRFKGVLDATEVAFPIAIDDEDLA
jgi:hypothetical protein